jgi:hypothetical protein
MGGTIHTVTKTVVVDTNAYQSGDFLGTAILEITEVGYIGGAVLHTVTVVDLTKQSAAFDLLFFTTACANTTFTNNAALDVHDTDALTFIGHVSVLATDYSALNDNSVATVRNIGLTLNPTPGTSIYCAPVARGTPTYAASELRLKFSFLRD